MGSLIEFYNLCVEITDLFLISDDDCKDDDIIFEDFARLRLKGAETEA